VSRATAADGPEYAFDRAMRAAEREDARKAKRRRAKASVPRNSIGQPWQAGETWTCMRCGAHGDDRDDVPVPDCTAGPYEPRRQPHGEIVYAPGAHHAAVIARGAS
jgi:hypothetical protein